MRKSFSFFVLFLMIFNISACNNKVDNSNVMNSSSISSISLNTSEMQNTQETSVAAESVEESNPVEESEGKPTDNKDINSLIPLGWAILMKDEPVVVQGDLNKDGIKDVATVIEELEFDTEDAPLRALLIAFGTANDSYTLSIIADKVILPSDSGGVWGDPFDSLQIERGTIVVSDYGGSNWRWYNKYRFRFQDNDWYLIGATMGEYYTGTQTPDTGNEEDYNLLTGDYKIRKVDENGKVTTQKGNRGRKELIKLKDFNLEDM